MYLVLCLLLREQQNYKKRCSKVGFDWEEISPVFDKVREELQEVQAEINRTSIEQNKVEEEIGDLLFATVNLARHLKM